MVDVGGIEFDEACCRLRKRGEKRNNEKKILNIFQSLHRACNMWGHNIFTN